MTSPLTAGTDTVGVLGNSESETEWDDSPLPAKKTNYYKQQFRQLQFLISSKRHSYKQKKPPKQFVKRKRKRQIFKQKQKKKSGRSRLDTTVTVYEGGC